jgi:phage anti-repressor protein
MNVNARELHELLGVGRDFSNWIKARIEKYNFVENQDFIISANSGEYSHAGKPKVEYHISTDMAKELQWLRNIFPHSGVSSFTRCCQ